jgi:hypothetical protein
VPHNPNYRNTTTILQIITNLQLLLLLQQILANKRNQYPLSDLGMGAQIPMIYHIKLHTFQHPHHPNNEKEIQANHNNTPQG